MFMGATDLNHRGIFMEKMRDFLWKTKSFLLQEEVVTRAMQ
jgi:hypothetical protein